MTTRLSLFFLTTLALVLLGFSVTLYILGRMYLYRQLEERLEAALNTLVAAADVGPDGLEWEPAERHLSLGPAAFPDQLSWLIRDDAGRVVDRSAGPQTDQFWARTGQSSASTERAGQRPGWQGEGWLFRQRWIDATKQETSRPAAQSIQKEEQKRYSALSITAGVPLGPGEAALRHLAGILAGLSLGIWVLALFAGRLVCRRALAPVSRMARAARDMDATDLERRLPAVSTKDELEDLNRAFNSLLDRLQESVERQQRFSGDASHQLRTPLAAILGQVEVIMRRQRSAEEYERVLAAVHRQADHLRAIVEALLFLARANSEALLPRQERLDLNEWLTAHLQTWHERAKDVVLEWGAGSCLVLAQPVLLGELLNILLDNACKYSPAGSPITVRLGREERAVVIEVEDHGCGIEAKDLARVFTPFFRAAATRRGGVEGAGLGLSIAKRLAEALDGSLMVSSRVGQGSCFSLRLPLIGNDVPSDRAGCYPLA